MIFDKMFNKFKSVICFLFNYSTLVINSWMMPTQSIENRLNIGLLENITVQFVLIKRIRDLRLRGDIVIPKQLDPFRFLF